MPQPRVIQPVPSSETQNWLARSLIVVLAITALRLILLAFNKTDLFVDETQYWLWGQSFDFGYYSKPPLIAWVIRVVTDIAGSEAPFWVRAPGAVFHGATALILAALAARMFGARAAVWVAASYLTLPFAALGSLLISTDTIMAPFFAAALLFHRRLVENGAIRWAILAGAMAGMAFLAKYIALFLPFGVIFGAALFPQMRISLRACLVFLASFALVILPNLVWNLNHDFATVSHTMDNVQWVREDTPLSRLNPAGLAEFFFSQFAVFGPILFAALLWSIRKPRGWGGLLAFSLPVLAVICAEAFLARAYANWAISAYFSGVIVAIAVLLDHRRLLLASVLINGTICLALPILTLMPETAPNLLQRYLGRADLSQQIIAVAQGQGGLPVVAEKRDVVADLFYTGRDTGLAFYALPQPGRPRNHYEMSYPLPKIQPGPVILIAENPPECVTPAQKLATLDTAGGAYAKLALSAWRIKADCLAP